MSSDSSRRSAKRFVDSDYESLESFIDSKGLRPTKWSSELGAMLRKTYQGIYALSLWDFKLDLPIYSKLFLSEARSDALTSIPLILSGFRKQAALSLRQTLEDVLRHVYYSKHEVEFSWLERERYFMPWKDLVDYLGQSILYGRKNLGDKLGSSIKRNYRELSKYIHTKSAQYAGLSLSLRDISFDERFFEFYCRQSDECMSTCNALLLLFRWSDYKAFDSETRSTIKEAVVPSVYKLLMETA